jgi:hypothetical protein
MPLVAGTEKKGLVSPDTESDIYALLFIAEIIDSMGFGYLRSLAALGRASNELAVATMVALLTYTGAPAGLIAFIVDNVGPGLWDMMDEIASIGLSPDDFYVWGNSDLGLPTGEFSRDSIFRANGINYRIKPTDPTGSLSEYLGLNPVELGGLLGFLPGVPNFEWLAIWDGVQPKIPVDERLQTAFVEQGAAMATGGGILADSVIRTSELTSPAVVPGIETASDTEIEITTGVEVNTTLLILAGALALTPAKLISIPIALAAFRGK